MGNEESIFAQRNISWPNSDQNFYDCGQKEINDKTAPKKSLQNESKSASGGKEADLLDQNLVIENNTESFICSFCHVELPDEKGLKMHSLLKHNHSMDKCSAFSDSSHSKVNCGVCDRTFEQNSDFEQHLESHFDEMIETMNKSLSFISTEIITEEKLKEYDTCSGISLSTLPTDSVKMNKSKKISFCDKCDDGLEFLSKAEYKEHKKQIHKKKKKKKEEKDDSMDKKRTFRVKIRTKNEDKIGKQVHFDEQKKFQEKEEISSSEDDEDLLEESFTKWKTEYVWAWIQKTREQN